MVLNDAGYFDNLFLRHDFEFDYVLSFLADMIFFD